MVEVRGTNILAGKPEVKKDPGGDGITRGKKVRCGLDSFGSGQDPAAHCSVHDNELLVDYTV
jgi:hypothetical protein